MIRATLSAVVLLCVVASAWGQGNVGSASARAALNRTLPEIKFNNIPLKDCIEFVRDVSGANIHINWKAIEASGVTPDTTVNIRLRSVTLRKVLTLLLSESAGGQPTLTFYVDQGVIEVTTQELADKQLITIVYPVQDLLMEVPDFDSVGVTSGAINNSTGSGQSGSGRSGGGGGGAIGGFGAGVGAGQGGGAGGAGAGVSKADRGKQLVDLIQDLIQPSIWDKAGGPASIRFFNGNLIVTAPRSVHEAIAGSGD